jgi:hypothetical protein
MTSNASPIAKDSDNSGPAGQVAPQTRQAKAVARRSKAGQVTGALKDAINYLVHECEIGDFKAAADHAGMTAYSMRCAMEKPHVKAYYRQQMEVLRSCEQVRNIKRAIAIRDAADNMPAMHAIKWLEGEQDQTVSGGRGGVAQSPGVTFVIVQGSAPAPMRDVGGNVGTHATLDAKPSNIKDIDGE